MKKSKTNKIRKFSGGLRKSKQPGYVENRIAFSGNDSDFEENFIYQAEEDINVKNHKNDSRMFIIDEEYSDVQ